MHTGKSRLFSRVGLVIVVSAVSIASVKAQQTIVHPRGDFIVRDVRPAHSMDLAKPAIGAASLAQTFSSARGTALAEGSTVTSFGQIERVIMGPRDEIYVIDREFNDVTVALPDGRIVQRIGRSHDRKSPVKHPMSVAVAADGQVLIGDLGRKLHVFRRAGDTLVFSRTLTIGISAYDLCVLGTQLVVQGADLTSSETIRTYSRTGSAEKRLATLYRFPNQLVRYSLSKGRIGCAGGRGQFVLAPLSGIPDVRTYTASGKTKWVTTFDKYRSVVVTSKNEGNMSAVFPRDGFHRLQNFSQLPSGEVLVQFALVTPAFQGKPEQLLKLTTVLLHPESGKPLAASEKLPAIAAVGRSHFVVTVPTSPAKLEVRRLPTVNAERE